MSEQTICNALDAMGYTHKKRIKSAQEKYNPEAMLLDARFRYSKHDLYTTPTSPAHHASQALQLMQVCQGQSHQRQERMHP